MKKRTGFDTMSPYLYPFYICMHPRDGFLELKANKKGSSLVVTIIIAAVVAAFAAIAFIVYKLFVKNLEKCYDEEDDLLLEEDDSCECECLQCDALTDAE